MVPLPPEHIELLMCLRECSGSFRGACFGGVLAVSAKLLRHLVKTWSGLKHAIIESLRNNAYVSGVLYYGGLHETSRDHRAIGRASSPSDRPPADRYSISGRRANSRRGCQIQLSDGNRHTAGISETGCVLDRRRGGHAVCQPSSKSS